MSLSEFLFGFSEATKRKHPHVFSTAPRDSHGRERTVPMEVLVLGMGRTGTLSMKAALEKLGYPTAHGFDMYDNPLDCDIWMEGFERKYFGAKEPELNAPFFDQILGSKAAVSDMPANCFAPELIAAYPNAKIILVERDVEKWFPSFSKALISNADYPNLVKTIGFFDSQSGKQYPTLYRGMMQGQFRSRDSEEWRAKAKEVYREHYAEIRRVIGERGEEERLLEYELGTGWGPLCEFLGREVPRDGSEFPRVNEGEVHGDMLKVVYVLMLRRMFWRITQLATPVIVGLLAWRLWLNAGGT